MLAPVVSHLGAGSNAPMSFAESVLRLAVEVTRSPPPPQTRGLLTEGELIVFWDQRRAVRRGYLVPYALAGCGVDVS